MIIADSGSTKTTWMEVATGNKFVTEGLNPHFTTDEQFLVACQMVREKLSILSSQLTVYFYGAGCGAPDQRDRVVRLLSAGFCTGEMVVETDMLGACRAVAGRDAALVGILGTGSNICFYDGRRIVFQPTSAGFIMGDNGSANHVGRILLGDYLSQRMPESVRFLFHESYPYTDAQFIDCVYHQPHPNRFLASLAPFAAKNRDDDYCAQVLIQALHDWYYGPLTTVIERGACSGLPLHVVGGFAKAVEVPLRNYMSNQGLVVGTVVADPIDGLRRYHSL